MVRNKNLNKREISLQKTALLSLKKHFLNTLYAREIVTTMVSWPHWKIFHMENKTRLERQGNIAKFTDIN